MHLGFWVSKIQFLFTVDSMWRVVVYVELFMYSDEKIFSSLFIKPDIPFHYSPVKTTENIACNGLYILAFDVIP